MNETITFSSFACSPILISPQRARRKQCFFIMQERFQEVPKALHREGYTIKN